MEGHQCHGRGELNPVFRITRLEPKPRLCPARGQPRGLLGDAVPAHSQRPVHQQVPTAPTTPTTPTVPKEPERLAAERGVAVSCLLSHQGVRLDRGRGAQHCVSRAPGHLGSGLTLVSATFLFRPNPLTSNNLAVPVAA